MEASLQRHQSSVPRCPRYQSLDLWRGIACLLVIVNHGSFFQAQTILQGATLWSSISGGLAEVALRMWIGVPIFFVISGYCISATADATRRRADSWVTYFKRRFRRIYPPYWICLAVTVFLVVAIDVVLVPRSLSESGLYLRPWWYGEWQWLGNLTLTEIWRYHLVGNQKALILGHAWTLCYEEQFYVVTGLILLFARQRFFTAAAVITLLCLLAAAICAYMQIPIDGFFFDGQWTLFACGILIYYILNYGSQSQLLMSLMLFTVGLVYSMREPARLLAPEKNIEQALFVALLFSLLLILMRPWDDWFRSQKLLRPLFACGTICYSLYLVHLPLIRFLVGAARVSGIAVERLSPLVSVPICMMASIGVAWVFFWLVERRFLNTTPRAIVEPSHNAPAGTLRVMPAAEAGM